jgi:hypothetical protein
MGDELVIPVCGMCEQPITVDQATTTAVRGIEYVDGEKVTSVEVVHRACFDARFNAG